MYIRIKQLRKKSKLSSKEIANYLNISESLYLAYESGKKQFPVHILSKLSQKYNTSIDYLIGNTNQSTPHERTNLLFKT